MSKTIQKLLLVGETAFVLASCGDETNVTKVTNETVGMEVAATADSLGTCDSTALGRMMFASDENAVYICADSGWTPLSEKAADGKDGADGLDGASCTVKTLSAGDGYKVICGGDSVGVILNGTDGADGKNGADGKDGTNGTNGTSCSVFALSDGSGYKVVCGGDSVGVILNGANGKDGANGTSCTAAALSDGSGYKIVCGGDSVGVILNGSDGKDGADGKNGADGKDGGSGCNLASDSSGIVILVCGTFQFAFCGSSIYASAAKFCQDGSLYSLCGGKSYDVMTEYCDGGTVYEVKSKFTDARDGKTYRTVKIGSQIWMAENLNYDYNQNTAKSYCYANSTDSCAKYGRLYPWSAAMDSAAVFSENGKGCGDGKTCSATKPVRGVCPEGWHLPSLEEWHALETYVADNSNGGVGYALKSISGWSPRKIGADAFGFGALPAGILIYSGGPNFVQNGTHTYFWCSTEYSPNVAYYRYLDAESTDVLTSNYGKDYARSVRCVKD